MGVRPVELGQLLELFRDAVVYSCLVRKSLIADGLSEKFVEVKLILHEKVDAAGVKLHYFFVHDL
jgi:hypothetical protein